MLVVCPGEVCSPHMIHDCNSRPTISDYYITMYDGSRSIDGANRLRKSGLDVLELINAPSHVNVQPQSLSGFEIPQPCRHGMLVTTQISC